MSHLRLAHPKQYAYAEEGRHIAVDSFLEGVDRT